MTPELERQSQAGPCGSLVSQTSLPGEFQASLKEQNGLLAPAESYPGLPFGFYVHM